MFNRSEVEDRISEVEEEGSEPGIDLVAVFAAIVGEWKIALLVFVIVAGLGLAYVRSLKPEYVASATILPTQGHTEADTLASLFSPRGGGGLYIGLLHSRSVQDDIIDRLHLMQHWQIPSREASRATLASKSSFSEGADSILVITVRDRSAEDAATIANAYLDSLQNLSNKMGQSQAAQTRKFFDHRLDEQRDELEKAETNLAEMQQRTGEVAPDSQAAIGIGNIAGLRSQLTGMRVQLSTLLQSSTEQNPEVQRLRAQIAAMETQERIQETGTGITPPGAAIAAVRIPKVNLELQRAQRDVASRAASVNSMSGQYGAARMDEEFSHTAFEVIDRAIPPEFKAWPPRDPYNAAALAAGVLAGLVAIFAKLLGARIWRTPEHRTTLRRLRGAL